MLLTLAVSVLLAAGSPTDTPARPSAQSLPQSTAEAVVFERLTIPDGDESVEIGVWTPSAASVGDPRPLVVISHGNGGDFRGHEDTARVLAADGFVVAALTHTGDNWRDQSRATDVALRPRQLHRLIDFMVGEWSSNMSVDPDRVGAFGFSAGGFTVLTAAGGVPDLARVADHCRANPGFYDCRLIAARPVDRETAGRAAWTHDPRIRSIVVAAPALGFTFTAGGLSGLTQPVQLWQAEQDRILPGPFYVEPVRDALPRPPEFHSVPGAGHFDFLPPCSPQLAQNAPMICAPTPGFDRSDFHGTFNREIVRFFRQTLRSGESLSGPTLPARTSGRSADPRG